jgi:hypothetical protein
MEEKMDILCEFILVLNYKWKQVPNYDFQEDCKICLNTLENGYILEPPCGHPIHRECAFQLVKCGYSNCPHCKTPFRIKKS